MITETNRWLLEEIRNLLGTMSESITFLIERYPTLSESVMSEMYIDLLQAFDQLASSIHIVRYNLPDDDYFEPVADELGYVKEILPQWFYCETTKQRIGILRHFLLPSFIEWKEKMENHVSSYLVH
ncbi:hypothetical protein [Radiobacillus deserti]|uniref:DUF8042 domain-containing protein n=1 Tax=Radiobacillus deserti TaxID=2594883 RepID=A0A516KIN5_9BACI|nr:hypothetical protein [Radiobacillus deserti]QDP41268.1 hypothetical protein FN924_14395 [Radiobacillus deserti]